MFSNQVLQGWTGEWTPPPVRGTRWKHKSGVELLTQHRLEKFNANAQLFSQSGLEKVRRTGYNSVRGATIVAVLSARDTRTGP